MSKQTELLDALEEWGKHFLETRNPAGLAVLRAKTTIKDQSERIGELLAALESQNNEVERLRIVIQQAMVTPAIVKDHFLARALSSGDSRPQDGRVCDCEDAPCCGHYEL